MFLPSSRSSSTLFLASISQATVDDLVWHRAGFDDEIDIFEGRYVFATEEERHAAFAELKANLGAFSFD